MTGAFFLRGRGRFFRVKEGGEGEEWGGTAQFLGEGRVQFFLGGKASVFSWGVLGRVQVFGKGTGFGRVQTYLSKWHIAFVFLPKVAVRSCVL